MPWMETLSDAMPFGVAVLDRMYRLRQFNLAWAGFASLCNPSAGRPEVGAAIASFLPGGEDALLALDRVLAGESMRREAVPMGNGGAISYWDSFLTPLVEDGQVTGIVHVVTDVTTRTLAQQEAELNLAALREREDQLRSLLEGARGFVVYKVAVDRDHPRGGRVVLVSPEMADLAGIQDPYRFESWFENIHPKDLARVIEANDRAWREGIAYNQTVRLYHPGKGEWRWVHTISTPVFAAGQLTHFNGLIVDITEQKRAEAIQAGQRQFLELLATGGTFTETIHALVRIIEEQWPGMLALVLLLDEDGRHLHHGAAISLPEEYTRSIEGLEIGPMVGSCGTAAYYGRRVIVEDTATDPRWEGLRELALRYNLRACWSEPILSPTGQVRGTFAMYYHQPRAPGEAELRTIEMAAHLAGVAIEHKLAQEQVQQAQQTLEERVHERTREIERRRRVAERLRDILTILNSNRPLDEILHYIVSQATALTESAACLLHHVDYERSFVTIEAAYGLPVELEEIEGFPLYSSKADYAILDRQTYSIADIPLEAAAAVGADQQLDPAVRQWRQVMMSKYRAVLAVPIVVKNEVYGSLAFYYIGPRNFSDEEVELAVNFADHAALAIENARLRAQAEQAAVAAERSRLARDLHDAVTQTLFSASLIAEVLAHIWERDPDEGKARLEELRQLTRGALAEMRALLLELRPAALEEAELGELLRQLAEATTGRTRIPVHLSLQGGGKEGPNPDLSPAIKVALYRIAQEALNNVARHSGATQVEVSLKCHDWVELCIQDNGCGFDPAGVSPEHLGLGIMRERAEAIGAQLAVQSHIGQGAMVRITWQQRRNHE